MAFGIMGTEDVVRLEARSAKGLSSSMKGELLNGDASPNPEVDVKPPLGGDDIFSVVGDDYRIHTREAINKDTISKPFPAGGLSNLRDCLLRSADIMRRQISSNQRKRRFLDSNDRLVDVALRLALYNLSVCENKHLL